jgi:hypothetical protein
MREVIYIFIVAVFFIMHSYCDDTQKDTSFVEQQKAYPLPESGFSYSDVDPVDIETGNYIVNLESYRNFYHREKVRMFVVNRVGDNQIMLKNNYQNGLLMSSYSSMSDTNPEYTCKYDEKGRILRSGIEWTYEYPHGDSVGGIERKVYFFEEPYRIEKIKALMNGYEVITITIIDKYEVSVRYIKNNGLIEMIIRKANGRERNWDIFVYDDDKNIKQITTFTNTRDDLRKTRTVIRRQGKNIQELEIKYFKNDLCEFTENWTFSNYDDYGNWHNAEWNSNLGFGEKYYRDFEYN